MSDTIISFNQIKDAEDVIVQYDVAYIVEDESGHTNNFCVVVAANELTDSSDVAEAKTKANVKALAIKTAWLSTLPAPVVVNQPAQVGEVTL